MRLPLSNYRIGPTGGYGVRRPSTGKVHWGVDMYPPDVETFALAPERSRVVAVRTTLDGAGALDGYGPGALRLVSDGWLSDALPVLRVWHTLGHLRPEDVERFAVGAVVEEGAELGRVFVPQYQKTGGRHLHYEVWRSASVPSGDARGPHTHHPERWAAWRRTVDAAAAAGGVAAVTAIVGGRA